MTQTAGALTINTLITALQERNKLYKGTQSGQPVNFSEETALIEIMGELGELSEVVKKHKRGDLTEAEYRQKLNEEIPDVIIAALLFALKTETNIGAAIRDKFNKTSRKRGYNVFLNLFSDDWTPYDPKDHPDLKRI